MYSTSDQYVVQYLDGDCSAKVFNQRIVSKAAVASNPNKCYSDGNGSYQMVLV